MFLPQIENSIPQWDIKVNSALAAAGTWAYKRPHAKGYQSNSINKHSTPNCTQGKNEMVCMYSCVI